MKKQNILIYLLISMLFTITACQKDIEKDIKDLNPIADCYLKDGRLVFKDFETFKEHINWIQANQTNPDVIKRKYETIGLTSLMTVYNMGMKLVDEEDVFQQYVAKHPTAFHKVNFDMSIIFELPTASSLAYITNENGIYQIGDIIYRCTFENNLKLSAENINKIDQLLLPISQINDPAIKITKSRIDNGLKSQYSYLTDYIQSDIRIVARLYIWGTDDGAVIYEARTTAQKKGFLGIWSQKIIDELSLNRHQGQLKYYSWNNPITISSINIFKTHESDIQLTYDTWYPVDLSQSSCLVDHYGKHGTTASINNNEIFQ